MTAKFRLYLALALSTMTTTPAFADVSALQVWDDWQALIGRTGTKMRFEQSISDSTLTINDLTFTSKASGKDDSLRVSLGSLVLQDQADGTVMILLPTDAPIVLNRGMVQITLNQSHKDLSLIVSGAPMDLTYSYKAAELALTLVEMLEAGQTLDNLSASATLNAIAGSAHSIDTGLRQIVQDVTIGSVSYSFDYSAVNGDTTLVSQGSVTDLEGRFDAVIPENMETGTMQNIIDAGFAVKGGLEYNDITADFAVTQRGDVGNATLSTERGGLDMWFGAGEGNLYEVSQKIALGPTKAHVDVANKDKDKDKDKGVLADLSIAQLNAGYTVIFPDTYKRGGFGETKAAELLDAGLSAHLGLGYDGIDGAFSVNDGDKSYAGSVLSATAGIDLFLDRNILRYTADTGTTEATMTAAELPIGPLKLSVSEIGSQWVIPLKTSNDPLPFSIHEKMLNLSVSDNLWAMFDPDGLLPRSPLSYVLDLSGSGNWLTDPFDEAFQNTDTGMPRGELHSLNLNEFKLSRAGLDLTGSGAFTFDNDDLETFDGIPAPTGALDLKLVGLNQLMDTLVQIGLLDEDEAFATRMGLGLFTVVGEGKDTLLSHIEARDDGHVLANGKRLK